MQPGTKGFDYTLTVYTLDFIRRRIQEIGAVVSTFRKTLARAGTHLHVKVTQEVTVNLPEDWKPRRLRAA